MKRLMAVAALVLLLLGAADPAPPELAVKIWPNPENGVSAVRQGQVLVVHVRPPEANIAALTGRAFDKTFPFALTEVGYLALVGVDMRQDTGLFTVAVTLRLADGTELKQSAKVKVLAGDFPTDKLTLPDDKVDLDQASLARVEADQKALARAWATPSDKQFWNGTFIRPVPGEVSGVFGRNRIINGQPKSPHSGQDLRAALGEPVKAANAGRVVLVRDCFFSGLSVVLNHGLGLYSMYFHLSEAQVKEGELVGKGQPIGLAGMSGRATGPHLHWGFRLNGARVDPDAVLALPLP